MKKLVYLGVVALLMPVAATAQSSGPYKLIITWHESNVTVIDYPSQARCEQALKAVEAEVERRQRASDEAVKSTGMVRIGTSPNGAFCIPG